jgi:uncharacterized protein (TIRG00374 family)
MATMSEPRSRALKTLIRLALLLAGVAVFGLFLRRESPDKIWASVQTLGWRLPLVLVPIALVYAVETLGWHFAFGSKGRHGLPFSTLYRIRLSGEAVNNVVPSATVGGDAVKVYLLHKRGVCPGDATASVIVGRTVQMLTQVTFIALGAGALAWLTDGQNGLGPAVAGVLVVTILLLAGMVWLQTHGMFGLVLRIAHRLRIPARGLEARRERLLRIDRQVLDFYRTERKHMALSAAGYLGGWLLDSTDLLLVSWLLGTPATWLQALAVEAFIGVARIVAFVVPGAIGVQEAGTAFMCSAVGLPSAFGVAYAVVRRGRDLVVAGLGWLLLYLEEASLKGLRAHVAAEMEQDGL